MRRNSVLKRRLSMLLALVLGAAFIATGCGDKDEVQNYSKITYPEDGIYPLECEDTLSVWRSLHVGLSTEVSNFSETVIAKELEKRTGIKVEYIHPAGGLVSEQLNLLIASNEMPDVMATNWYNYGAQSAIDEGTIVPLNDVLDKWAPNYKKVLEDNSTIANMMKSSEGEIYGFNFIRGDETLCSYIGPIVRKDWLDDLGLPVPETLEEWEKMLVAFKEEKNAQAALSLMDTTAFENGMIIGAFGITDTFYVEDGKVKYGALEPSYKDFLRFMNDWNNKGLIDKDIAGSDRNILTSNVLNGKTGATFLEAGGGIGSWITSKRNVGDNKFSVVGASYPVKNKGDKVQFSQYDWAYVPNSTHAITTSCKNVELAARYLDYGYSEEGELLYNFGIEGETYNIVDGKPEFTEYVTKNPDGKTVGSVLIQYAMGTYSGPLVQNKIAVNATRVYPEQNEALVTWSNSDMKLHKLPYMDIDSDSSAELSTIITDLKTYKDEMLFGFIYGTESFDDYEIFIERLKEIGVDRALEIYQQAYDSYIEN